LVPTTGVDGLVNARCGGAAFPKALVLAVAGLALVSTIASSLSTAMKDEGHRDGALSARKA
jgi:predicted benzoate:H+ symporter BenE